MRLGLTERQKSVYDGIINFQKEHGYAHLKTLEEYGYIKKREGSPRTITIEEI